MRRTAVTGRAAAVMAAGLALVLAGCGSGHPGAEPPSPTTAKGRAAPLTTRPGSRTAHHHTASASTLPPTTLPASTTSTTASSATSSTAVTAPTTSAPPATPATTDSGAPGSVQVIADCQTPSYEPTTIVLACGDGTISATQISWTAWGPSSATGTAVIRANLCQPTCAQGSIGTFPANITLSGVTSSTNGPVFSTLTAHFTGASPTATSTETYSIGPIG